MYTSRLMVDFLNTIWEEIYTVKQNKGTQCSIYFQLIFFCYALFYFVSSETVKNGTCVFFSELPILLPLKECIFPLTHSV